jgi:hypothetical protein
LFYVSQLCVLCTLPWNNHSNLVDLREIRSRGQREDNCDLSQLAHLIIACMNMDNDRRFRAISNVAPRDWETTLDGLTLRASQRWVKNESGLLQTVAHLLDPETTPSMKFKTKVRNEVSQQIDCLLLLSYLPCALEGLTCMNIYQTSSEW